MMGATLLALALVGARMQADEVQLSVQAPDIYLEGQPFRVTVTAQASAQRRGEVETWALTPSAFHVGGRVLGARPAEVKLTLQPGQVLSTTLDLAPAIRKLEGFARADFALRFMAGGAQPRPIRFVPRPERGIDFMELPDEQLADYEVVMLTSRGRLWIELWPDTAPNHVRNFLDLAQHGFYDGTKFHRVIPGFMIQGGGPREGETAPRKLQAEFSRKRHEPGVLSMGRLPSDLDSASSQFFVMHGRNPQLDGRYSVFGKLLEGLDVVEEIVHSGNKKYPASTEQGWTPPVDQIIEKAIVVKAGHFPGKDKQEEDR
jgi:peptidyl-prolyl cis-trans isomerase B (cyclophilin B)